MDKKQLVLIILGAATLLAGCGQKGPLVLPTPQAKPSASSVPTSPTSASSAPQ